MCQPWINWRKWVIVYQGKNGGRGPHMRYVRCWHRLFGNTTRISVGSKRTDLSTPPSLTTVHSRWLPPTHFESLSLTLSDSLTLTPSVFLPLNPSDPFDSLPLTPSDSLPPGLLDGSKCVCTRRPTVSAAAEATRSTVQHSIFE